MANKLYKNKNNLYVCFEVNRKYIFNLSFCIVIVNAPRNNQCFDEMAQKHFQNVSFTYTILRLESFVGTSVRDLENELFFKIIPVIILWQFLNLSAFAKIVRTARWIFLKH